MWLDGIEPTLVKFRAEQSDFKLSKILHPQENDYYRTSTIESYYRCMSGLAEIVRPERVAEIGTRRGYLAAAFVKAGYTKFYLGIDIDKPNGWGGVADGLAYAHTLLADSYRKELPSFLLVTANSFEDQSWLRPTVVAEGYFDLVALNADLSYECVLNDLHSAWQMLAAGGLIFVMNSENASVKEALNTFKKLATCHTLELPLDNGLTLVTQDKSSSAPKMKAVKR